VEKDMTKGLTWARKVALQGDLKYQKWLATIYDKGDGVARDKVEAANWYRLAANQGDTHAQRTIGLMCASGEQIKKDPVEALKWLTLCGDNSDQVATLRQNLELGMSTNQMQDVKQAVRRFLRVQQKKETP
jgi:uncharacterized protein